MIASAAHADAESVLVAFRSRIYTRCRSAADCGQEGYHRDLLLYRMRSKAPFRVREAGVSSGPTHTRGDRSENTGDVARRGLRAECDPCAHDGPSCLSPQRRTFRRHETLCCERAYTFRRSTLRPWSDRRYARRKDRRARLESSVIDGLGLCYLSVRPVKYHLRRSKTDLYRIKRVVFR